MFPPLPLSGTARSVACANNRNNVKDRHRRRHSKAVSKPKSAAAAAFSKPGTKTTTRILQVDDAEAKRPTVHYELRVSLGLSLVGQGDVPRCELAYLRLRNVRAWYSSDGVQEKASVTVEWIQLDNQLQDASLPVVLYLDPGQSQAPACALNYVGDVHEGVRPCAEGGAPRRRRTPKGSGRPLAKAAQKGRGGTGKRAKRGRGKLGDRGDPGPHPSGGPPDTAPSG